MTLEEYIEFRASCGEKITDESWIVRDIWKSTNVKFQNRGGLATVPRRLKSSGVRSIISRAEWEQGIREPLTNGKKRHEFQAVHSLRKFFKSHCEQVMKSINVEILMGHTIGVSNSYYKPSQKEILDDYLKAIYILTINKNDNNVILEKEVKELKEKNENNDYLINGRLQEKEQEINDLKKSMEFLTNRFNAFLISQSENKILYDNDEQIGIVKGIELKPELNNKAVGEVAIPFSTNSRNNNNKKK